MARARAPAPAVADVDPAAVVRRREAPRCVVDPAPAPRVDPRPASVAIRRPADRDRGREPDRAVAGVRGPAAVAVEVGIADDLLGHVLTRHRARVAIGALEAPAVEVVAARQVQDFVVAQRGVVEAIGLAVVDAIAGAALAIDRAAALEDRHHRRIALRGDVDAVVAGPVDDERERRRVDLVGLAVEQALDLQVQRALGQLDLDDVVVDVEEGQARAIVHAQHRGADLQLDARVAVGIEAVAADQRAVDHRLAPAVVAAGLEARVAADVAHAGDAAGRIGQRGAGERDQDQRQQRPSHREGRAGSHIHGVTPARIGRSRRVR